MDHIHLLDDLDMIDMPVNVCRQRNFYATREPFNELTDYQFRAKYRMTKASFLLLHDLVKDKLREAVDDRGHPSSTTTQLLIALRFYATGTFQDVMGDGIGVSQSHTSVVVKEVSHVLASLSPDFIRLPSEEEAKEVSVCLQTDWKIIIPVLLSVTQEVLPDRAIPSCMGTDRWNSCSGASSS